MMNEKAFRLLILLWAALSSIIFSGSSIKAPEKEKKVGGMEADPAGNASTVNVLISGAYNLLPFKLFEERIEKESGIELNYITISSGDLYMKTKETLLQDKGNPDLAVIQPSWLPEFVQENAVKPLEQFTGILDPELGDIFPPYLEFYCKYGKRLYGLPFDGDVRIYYYRKDLLDNDDERKDFKAKYGYELGIPRTLEQANDFAQFFTRTKGELLAGRPLDEDFYGIAMTLGSGWCHYEWMDHFAAYNGFYFDEGFRPTINDEAGIRALEDIKRLLVYAPSGALSSGYSEVRDAFLSGNIASLILWSDMYKFIFNDNLSKVRGKVGVSIMPGAKRNGKPNSRATMPHGDVLVIPSLSKVPEKAFWVASYMSTIASEEYTLDPRTNCDPFRYSHITKAETLSNYLTYFSGKEVSTAECEKYLAVIADSMNGGVPDLLIPFMREYIEVLDLYIHRVLTGELDGKNALDSVAERWEEINRNKGYENQKESWKKQYSSWEKLGPAKQNR
jgi:multiple sugar transport system substrate-binding protein